MSIICPIGKYCPEGSAEPQDCAAGYYTDFEGADACEVCPEGETTYSVLACSSLNL